MRVFRLKISKDVHNCELWKFIKKLSAKIMWSWYICIFSVVLKCSWEQKKEHLEMFCQNRTVQNIFLVRNFLFWQNIWIRCSLVPCSTCNLQNCECVSIWSPRLSSSLVEEETDQPVSMECRSGISFTKIQIQVTKNCFLSDQKCNRQMVDGL